MQTVHETQPFPAYYGGTARVMKTRDGTYRTVGAGYSGRVRYRTVERAVQAVESNAQFTGWAA